jgi:hypothetical protein
MNPYLRYSFAKKARAEAKVWLFSHPPAALTLRSSKRKRSPTL